MNVKCDVGCIQTSVMKADNATSDVIAHVQHK